MSKNVYKPIIRFIGLQNFKGYREASIPLAPITLFFGPNSAGKSTVFQVLYLLKQTLQFAPKDVPLLFRCDNGYVDLGSFEDVIYDHDTRLDLCIKINDHLFTFLNRRGRTCIERVDVEADDSCGGEYSFEVKEEGGKHWYYEHSAFYPWAFGLLHKHRQHMLWALEQECIVAALDSLMQSSPPKGEEAECVSQLRDAMLRLRQYLYETGEDGFEPNKTNVDGLHWPQLSRYHYGLGVDLREVVSPEIYKERSKVIAARGWDSAFEVGISFRIALAPEQIKDRTVRQLFKEMIAILQRMITTEAYKRIYREKRKEVKPQVKLFSNDFSEDELWSLLGIREDRLGVKMQQFIPDVPFGFEERGDDIVERWLGCLALCGIDLGPQINIIKSDADRAIPPEVQLTLLYSDWNSLNRSGRPKLDDRMPRGVWGRLDIYRSREGAVFGSYHDKMKKNSTIGREKFIQWLRQQEYSELSRIVKTSANDLRDIILNYFQPVGPIRLSPRRHYSSSYSRTGIVGFWGQWVGDVLLDSAHCKAVNKWLELLTGYEVRRKEVGDILPGTYVLEVRDKKRKRVHSRKAAEWVKITDVGFGISQILPLVVQLVGAKDSVITIEQPESQIHPALQADFAELVVCSMKENHNQIMIETHSEHFILALKKMIRLKKIAASDILVNYVQRTENGSGVTTIPLGEDGQFKKEWPDGFFRERRKLITDAE
jgi:hypothetical protein